MSRSTWMAGLALAAFLTAGMAGSAPAQDWAPQASGTAQDLNAVWFRTPAAGWAVGNAGTALVTANAGQTWTPVNLVPQDLHDVAFLDPSVGLIAGDNGVILRTLNGGANWAPVTSNTGSQLRAIAFGGGGLAYAAGRDGTILRSTSSGAAWAVVETGTVRYLGATASGAQFAWIVGEGGVIRATTDGGLSWINPLTMLGRAKLAEALLAEKGAYEAKLDPAAVANRHGHPAKDRSRQFLVELYLQGDLAPEVLEALPTGPSATESTGTRSADPRQLAARLASLPEFQLA